MSLRDTILKADDIAEEIVDVPEWDIKADFDEHGIRLSGGLLLRAMDGKQHAQYIDVVTSDDSAHRYADILINSAYDPDTEELVFDPADRDALMEKDGGVLMRLSLIVIRDLSGGDVAEAAEELEADPTSDGS